MQSELDAQAGPTWNQLSPLLDEAMLRLGQADRNALVLRYFEGRSLNEVGAALGASEEAAKKRVNRALEKLRHFFAKRGVDSTTAAIVETISANSVLIAPATLAKTATAVALAKGVTTPISTLTLIKGALKIMAWTRIKTAVAVGTVALLAAGTAWQKYEIHLAGHGLVTLHVVNAPLGEVLRKLEQQSGQTIAWDRRLDRPVTLTVNNMPLASALNLLILQAGAYWTVDYAVFDSKSALQKLESALHGEMELRDAGWTNLSSGPLNYDLNIKSVRYDGTQASSSGSSSSRTPGRPLARMTVTVPATRASPEMMKGFQAMRDAEQMPQGPAQRQALDAATRVLGQAQQKSSPQGGNPVLVIAQAVRAGTNDGVLAPERMLAEIELLPRIDEDMPVAATTEKAEQIAKKAHASWAIIYTLRQSPWADHGITLLHQGDPVPLVATSFAQSMQQVQIENLTTLTPEQRVLHAQTLANLKQNH